MSSKVRVNEGSVEQRCVMIIAGDEGDEFGTSYLVMMNILLVQEQEESREKWMNELMGRQVNCAATQYGRPLQARGRKMSGGGAERISLSVD